MTPTEQEERMDLAQEGFPQTWYRSPRWGDPSKLDELTVHRATDKSIWLEKTRWVNGKHAKKLCREDIAGASPSKEVVLRAVVAQIDRTLQRLNDERSIQMQRRQNAMRLLALSDRPATGEGE